MSGLFIRYGIRAQEKAMRYVKFINEDGSDIKVTPRWTQSNVEIEYSLNSGSTWSSASSGVEIENANRNSIYFRGKAPTNDKRLFTDNLATNSWVSPDTTRIEGNLNYLLCDNLGDKTPPNEVSDYAFAQLFRNFTALTKGPELSATTIAGESYASMFENCTSLERAPSLPATNVPYRAYSRMFQDCTSLTGTITLPATTLGPEAYYKMFEDTSITGIQMYFEDNDDSYTMGWVAGITTNGELLKAGDQYTEKGSNTYPNSWTQVSF